MPWATVTWARFGCCWAGVRGTVGSVVGGVGGRVEDADGAAAVGLG